MTRAGLWVFVSATGKGRKVTYQKKRRLVEQLLDHWEDFFERASSGAVMIREEPNRPMSKDWTILSSMSRHPSVVELARVLADLRKLMPRRYGLLVAYYDSDSRLVNRPIKRKDARGRWVDDVERVRERVLNRQLTLEARCREPQCPCGGVLPGIVCRAVDDLLTLWRSPCKDPAPRGCECKWCAVAVKLELPAALNRKLREFTDQDGTHLTEAA